MTLISLSKISIIAGLHNRVELGLLKLSIFIVLNHETDLDSDHA